MEYLADHVFCNVYNDREQLLCEHVEGFSVVRPDDYMEYDLLVQQDVDKRAMSYTNVNDNDPARHIGTTGAEKWQQLRALVVLSKCPSATLVVDQQQEASMSTTTRRQRRTEVNLHQGDIVLYKNNPDRNYKLALINPTTSSTTDNRGELLRYNDLAFFDHLSIRRRCTVSAEEIGVMENSSSSSAQTVLAKKRLDAFIFAQTFSSNGTLYCEGYDEVGRNMDDNDRSKDECKVNAAAEKVRMVKTYQQMRGHRRLNVRCAQLYGLIPYTTDSKTDAANFSNLESELKKRGIWYEDDIRTIHPQLVSLDSSDFNNFAGQDKWLGGVGSPCGRFIYGVPGTATQVLRVTVSSGKVELIGPHFHGKFKWLRGVAIPASVMGKDEFPSGVCIAIPCNSKSVLRIDPHSGEVIAFGHATLERMGKWLYHGGELASDGYVYAIPANAERVLKIDPRTMETSLIGPVFQGVQKWYGGLLAGNGAIYGRFHPFRLHYCKVLISIFLCIFVFII